MFLSQTALGLLYLYGAILGFFAGFFYDCLRITRIFFGEHYGRSIHQKLQSVRLPLLAPTGEKKESPILGILVFLQDLFFCILCGIMLAILFYEANDGVIRLPVLLVFAGAFLLYRLTLCRLIMAASEFAAFLVETSVRYFWFFLSYPFRFLGRLLARLARILFLKIQSRVLRLQRARFYRSEKYRLDHGMGLFGEEAPLPPKQKRGKQHGNRKKETIQPVACDSDLSCGSGRPFSRRACHQHHERTRPVW